MYRCDECHEVTKAGVPMTKVVVETRIKHYTDDAGNVVGVGREIVREVAIGPCCKVL